MLCTWKMARAGCLVLNSKWAKVGASPEQVVATIYSAMDRARPSDPGDDPLDEVARARAEHDDALVTYTPAPLSNDGM